ncbi:P-loop containing nucleoside triphosphate hydrolase protein [Chytriomyces sp. MP71]|nr:P-loop containing nucleoside triphosphate hydrolase protein [Chytriomyces sp. MP71]
MVRPPPRQTGSASGRLCVGVAPRTNSVLVSRDDGALNAANSGAAHNSPSKKTFSFNKVHGVDASQEHVYALSCAGLVHQFVDGFNVTIFAYGQTSSGKTYTMGSTNHFDTSEHEMGIIPRVVHQVMNLISMKQKMDPNISFIIRCTFLEIYQEQVRDLLMPGNDAKDIAIREDRNGSVTVSGVHEETVHTAEDLFRCLERGGIERTTGDTKMHLHSSRSHAVFTLILEQRLDTSKLVGMETDEEAWGAGAPAQSHSSRLLRCSKLHLVDLAGSERVKRTGAEGVRLKESVKINSGLLALGNVISVLGEMHESSGGSIAANMHVPYRDSKLTRLLQNSLGGNAKTLMLACISPCDEDYEETLNTLKYADRARKIQNKPVINTIDHQAVKLASMQERIDFLESQIKKQTEVALNINPSELPSQRSRQDSSDISFAQAAFVDVENDKVLAYFVEELKNRTIRGTNAIRALQDANNENKRLMDRITDLEERLHKTRLASESITAQYEKCKLQVYDANAMHARLQTDFNIVFNTLENIVTLFASIPFNGNNVEHTVAWQRIQESMDDRKWQSFVAVCDLHRPTLIQEKFEVIESRFPAISGDALTSAALSKPSSRKSSAFGSRFQRRSLKV